MNITITYMDSGNEPAYDILFQLSNHLHFVCVHHQFHLDRVPACACFVATSTIMLK